MKIKPRKPAIPRPARDTVRHAVIGLLHDGPVSAREISAEVHIPEKEVYVHLEHIRRSIQAGGDLLEVTPAECRDCGFIFVKRERLAPPSKCPICRGEAIFDPLYSIRRH